MTTTEKECALVASVLCAPHAKLGPNTCTALGFWQYWESPEACKLAEAILKCVRNNRTLNPYSVRGFLESDYQKWPFHPVFTERGALPVSCLESVAGELLPGYRRRRIASTIADAYQAVVEHPESTVKVAKSLVHSLESVV